MNKMDRNEAIEKVRQMSLPKETMEILEAIAPELRESEDERIRVAMVKLFGGCIKDEEFCHTGFTYAQITDWLEKQKEQKQEDEAEKFFDSAESYHQGFIAGRYAGYAAAKEEQKPSEWSDEDKMNLNGCICSLHQYGYMTYADFLKHLPERFNLQPKQELSEEDEGKLQKCIKIVERWEEDYDIAYAPYSNMLKSLRPQPHWKPSEEQMRGLAHTINLDVYDAQRYKLDTLYNDLKKLM